MLVTAALLSRLSLIGLAATTLPAPARAGTCRVELVPADATRAWVAAASALRESLRDGGPADRDCSRVVIHAVPERPSVEVTTLDGRRGVRRLADARDIEPTVAALIVTVLADASAGGVSRADAAIERAPEAPDGGTAAGGWRPHIVGGAGARVSLPSAPAPVVELTLGLAHPRWEVGVSGAWAPTNATAALASTTEVALAAARRQEVASSVDLVYGARAGVILLVEGNSGGGGSSSMGGVAPAATGFLGAVFPARSPVRLRPQLWFQWAPTYRIGANNASSSFASVGLSLGAESSLP
jgi:hypothetical protein